MVLIALSQLQLEPLASVDIKDSQSALLLALASAKRIGDFAFSVDSDCIHCGPGDCGVTLWPRITCLKSPSTPFRTQTVSLSALFSESSTSRDANAQIRCAQSGLWGFTSTVRPAFGNLTSNLVCYGGCAKGRIKTEASHWIVDAITAAYTSQGLECPFHIRVYSTRVIASSAWLRGMSIREICFAAGWSSQNTLPGFTSWTVSPWPPKCCRWVTDSRLCYLYSYVFAASHSNYSVQPFYAIVVVGCPVLSAAPVIQCIFYWCTIMFCVDCC